MAFDEATESTLFRLMIPPFIWKPMKFLDIGYEKGLRKAIDVVHGFVNKMIMDRICMVNDEETLDNRSDVLTRIIQIENNKKGNKIGPSTIRYSVKVAQDHVVVPRVTTNLYMKYGLKVTITPRLQEETKLESCSM
ncbi:hypothetical protein Bca52824_092314 [Brassica carinata]|uniref:Uncharacterized protein n=1 Tax=Brassica carinata TaxID=52824 RepID=A0A8X7NV28_BRACI|nr:hypothetical protein Bca52824_092314 [Brassica carinata]